MSRLLTSSKFMGPALLAVAAAIGILLGFDDEKSAKLYEVLVWVTGLFGVGYQVSTAFEDRAKKDAAAGAAVPPASITPMMMIFAVSIMVLSGATGCQIFDPGGQTAKAFNQDYHFGLDAQNNFAVQGTGSQNGKFVMARGDGVTLNEDGTVNPAKSSLNAYLAYEPKSDDIRDAYGMALEASTRQMDRISNSFDNLLGLFVLSTMRPNPASGDADIADLIRQRVKAEIVAQIQPPVPEPVPQAPVQPPPQAAPTPPPQQPSVPVPQSIPQSPPSPPAIVQPPTTAPAPEPVPATAPAAQPSSAPASQPATRDAVMG